MSERLEGMSPGLARHVLDRMGSTGQPPERGALLINVGTEEYLRVLRDEYLRPMKEYGRNSTFKLVQAPFGGGKTQFLHCLRELAWQEGFVTALVGLSPRECPFDRPVLIYREVARRLELTPQRLTDTPATGIDQVLRHVAFERIDRDGPDAFLEWVRGVFLRAAIESRSFARAVRGYLEAMVAGDLDEADVLADYLRGESVDARELTAWRLREKLEDEGAFRWLRSLVQVLSALELPGVVLLFDEMDRNMSLSTRRRRDIGDNLRQMIDYCGQSLLPGVVWCYAVPPEFLDTVVPEYPALAQRLKGAQRFSSMSPMQPVIDLDHLPLGPTRLLEEIGLRLLELAEHGFEQPFDRAVQEHNLGLLAREFGERQFESGTRRQFVKAAAGMLDRQRREGERRLDEDEIRELAGSGSATGPALMPEESEF